MCSIKKCLPEEAVHKFVGNTIPRIEIVYGFQRFLNGMSVLCILTTFNVSLHFLYTPVYHLFAALLLSITLLQFCLVRLIQL